MPVHVNVANQFKIGDKNKIVKCKSTRGTKLITFLLNQNSVKIYICVKKKSKKKIYKCCCCDINYIIKLDSICICLI